MKVLLIEDNRQNASVFVRMFNQHGYENVTVAPTGLDGLEAAQQGKFDVILIDFDLPDLHGLQVGLSLYTQIKRGVISKAVLIALTAQSDKSSQEEAAASGFDAFAGKPCIASDLLGVIDKLIHAESDN